MANKPHIKLNSTKQKEASVTMSFNYGFRGNNEDDDLPEEPNYDPMVDSFRNSIIRFNADVESRRRERNEALEIPAHIDYLQVLFQDQFNITKFNQSWFNDFGLLGVNFSHFNREVLFAVVDQDKFASFLQDIQNFVLKESGEDSQATYRGKVKFIKSFKLLTTQDILSYQESVQLMNFKLVDFPAGSKEGDAIYRRLTDYLQENQLAYRLIEEVNVLEVYGATSNSIEEIAKNFDILLSVTSSLSTVVRPSALNTVEREYGFEVSNADDDLPIIGILDTGISNNTPLASILVDDNTFNLTDSSSFVDKVDHGTAVGALAALGKRPYSKGYRGNIEADAKLLSMKILDGNRGFLSSYDILELLRKAKAKYPEIKLFVLVTCYQANKLTNGDFSPYAFELDRFAHEHDCLIFICTGNNYLASNQSGYDLNYFSKDETNLCPPADSMNNVVVGAAAGNLVDAVFVGVSHGREFPTIYTRRGHIDLEQYKKPNKKFIKNNIHLFKPDVIECGGDYEQSNGFIGTGEDATMELLSANPTVSFRKDAGTSFATPLVANVAAQILRTYPSLRVQTVKALIINAASLDAIRFGDSFIKLRNKTAGHGLVDSIRSATSTDDAVTFVIEDEIKPEEMKVIPLHFPTYLTRDNLDKKSGILRLTATLCFSFDPVLNNQLAYCPVQMAFTIFRNHEGNDILKPESEVQSKLKKSWSQNNRWKSNPIPASNTQKMSFLVSTKDLENEQSIFKLAVHCLINSQVLADDKYNTFHPFSMAITVEENLPEARKTGKLYTEITAVNEIENIIYAEGEAVEDIELEE